VLDRERVRAAPPAEQEALKKQLKDKSDRESLRVHAGHDLNANGLQMQMQVVSS
jgi:hypothetical protein